MVCQRCNQREATVHLTKIINEEKTELYLCEKCAQETGQIPFNNNPFSFQNLLSGILNPELSSIDSVLPELICDTCGMSYKEFTQKGLFGCADCYETFSSKLDTLLKRIHGSNRHNGKVPQRSGGNLRIKQEIEQLRKELQLAIEHEYFEKAAELRDQIHGLVEKLEGE